MVVNCMRVSAVYRHCDCGYDAVVRGGAAWWRCGVTSLRRWAVIGPYRASTDRDSATTTPWNIPFSSVFSWHSSVTLLRFRGLRNSSAILAMVKNFRLTLKLTLTTLCALTKNGFPWKFIEMFAALYIRSTGCRPTHSAAIVSKKPRSLVRFIYC